MKLSKPYFFLLTLVIILVFIIGVRYGQQVERVNKTVNYLLSITPSKSPTPTPTWTMTEYKTKTGVKINYPSFLRIEETTKSGEILIK